MKRTDHPKTRQVAMVNQVYERLLNRFLSWAQRQESVRTVFQIGSRTRQDHPADEWADVDLIIYATDFNNFVADTSWLETIAPVWFCLPPTSAGMRAEMLVMFEEGYNIDFVFRSTKILTAEALKKDSGFRRGARILLDRDGLAAQTMPTEFKAPVGQPPPEDYFLLMCNGFWYTTVFVARQICRGKLWLAKRHDALSLKAALLYMLEWHSGVSSQWQQDTWYDGCFVQDWADPRALAQVTQIFGAYDPESASKALLATVDLFRWLAQETAEDLVQ